MLLLELLNNRGEAVDGGRDNGADGSTQDTCVPKERALGQDRQRRQDDRKLEKHFAKMESERLPAPQMTLLLQALCFLLNVFVVILVLLSVLLILRALFAQLHPREKVARYLR